MYMIAKTSISLKEGYWYKNSTVSWAMMTAYIFVMAFNRSHGKDYFLDYYNNSKGYSIFWSMKLKEQISTAKEYIFLWL